MSYKRIRWDRDGQNQNLNFKHDYTEDGLCGNGWAWACHFATRIKLCRVTTITCQRLRQPNTRILVSQHDRWITRH